MPYLASEAYWAIIFMPPIPNPGNSLNSWEENG